MAGSRTPKPIGMTPPAPDEARESEYYPPGAGVADPRPLGLDVPQPLGPTAPAAGGGGVEITVIGKFKNVWLSDDEEGAHMAANPRTWHPTIDDFDKVAEKDTPNSSDIETVYNFATFLGSIQARSKIDRVSVLTHSNSDVIAFSGKVDRATGDVTLNLKGGWTPPFDYALDFQALTDLRATTALLKQIRGKFTTEAEMIFYSCKSGLGPLGETLLQDIADTFQVVTRGFTDAIWYFPTFQWKGSPPKVTYTILDRTPTAVGQNPPGVSGFHHLKANVTKKPNKTKYVIP